MRHMYMVTGNKMKVTTVNLQLAFSMNRRTITDCVAERVVTLTFREMLSETVIVSAANLLVILPVEPSQIRYSQ